MLAEDEDGEHYEQGFESLFAPTQAIAGEVAKEQIRPEKLLWSLTDASGGEGGLIYYPQDPTTYDVGSLINPTTRGKLTTRAQRYRTSLARAGSNADTGSRPAGISTYTHGFIWWEDNLIQSINGLGWVATQDTSPAMTGTSYSDAISDGTTAAGLPAVGNAANIVPTVSADSSTIAWVDTESGTTVFSQTAGSGAVGCVLDGVPYVFSYVSTLTLYKKAAVMDSIADWAGTVVYPTGIVPVGLWGEDYWTDCEAAETSLFFSYSSQNQCFVWESRADVGRPFGTGPPGFAGKRLVSSSGVLFVLGNQATSGGRKYAGMWAIPLSRREPIFVAAPRKHKNTELRDFSIGCAGQGAYIYAADAGAGKMFVYDIERNALSLFDDLANGGTGDGTSFSPYVNLMPTGATSIEANATTGGKGAASLVDGWFAETNCTATRSTTVGGRRGPQALRLSWTAGGNMAAITDTGLGGTEGSPSTAYAVSIWFRAGASVRDCNSIIRWYDSTGCIISSTTGTDAADAVGSWTEVTATGTSPATAATAAIAAQVQATGAGSELHYIDATNFQQGATVGTDRMAFLALHGTRLYTATYKPLDNTGTSLQIISWDDLLPENRDDSQAISATWESAEWDNGLPMEIKALIGFYVTFEVTDTGTTSGLIANSRITVSYAIDGGAYTDTTVITSATTPSGAKGRVFIQASDGTTTIKYSRLKVKATLDNNATAGVAPPILFGITPESQLMAYARTWNIVALVENEESNERPRNRQHSAAQIRDLLIALATNKDLVTFLDGYDRPQGGTDGTHFTSHTVMVEDPVFKVRSEGLEVARIKLRSVS